MMARFSEAFLVLKASASGLSNAWVPLIMVVMSVVYSLSSYPGGRAVGPHRAARACWRRDSSCWWRPISCWASARRSRRRLLGVALWGLHMGLTQGGLSSMVADTAPADLRGTAFGVFNLASGTGLAGGQRAGRGVVGCFGTGGDIPLRRGFRRSDAAWPSVDKACASQNMREA